MSKDKNPTLPVPQLRFPEFRDAPPWVPTSLAKAFRTITNGKANAQDHDEDGKYPLFDRSETIKRSPGYMFDAEAVILPGEGAHFTPRRFGGKFNLHQRAYALMDCSEDIDFAYYALDEGKGRLANKAVQSTVLSLRMPIIEKFTIACPDPAEQRKIAECLGSLDDWIAAETDALAALRRHKTGLMQQLFPHPGKTSPRMRFPQFREHDDWRVDLVGNVVSTMSPPKRLPTTEYQAEGEYPIVDQSPAPMCGRTDDGDAVIRHDLPVIVFGDHTCVVKYVDRPFAQGADGIKILHPQPSLDVLFLHYSLQAYPVESKQYRRHFSILKQRPVAFPNFDSGEQQRIAACLAALDVMIEGRSQMIALLRDHKRGLMQQLFPEPEGHTGGVP